MKSPVRFSKIPLFLLFILSAHWLAAQQNPTVRLVGRAMRAPLDVAGGQSTIQLCDLTPGSTYVVTATSRTKDQPATFRLSPTAAMQNVVLSPGKDHSFRFKTLTECVDVQVQSDSRQPATSVPMFLSVLCESCPKDERWKQQLQQEAGLAVIQINTGISAEDLINNTLIGGNCFNVSNVTYAGQADQIGTFSNGSTNIGFSNGVILATGQATLASGPNDQDNASAGYGIGTQDADLSNLTPGSIFDLANIEFDFTPTVGSVTFDFAFASEEYCEYVNTSFNDVFGFFISGPGISGTQNLAVVGSGSPVSINTINHQQNSSLYVNNTPASGTLCGQPPATGVAVNELQYDGFTKQLSAVVNVVPCQTYHIKLKIADVGDGIFDSAVFLRANSFAAGGSATVETVYPAGQSFAYEGCNNGFIRFVRNSGDINQPLTVNFTVAASSTATAGLDYAPLTSPVVIPAGQSELLVPVTVFGDTLTEGQESVNLLVSNSCTCAQAQVSFLIQDRVDLSVSLDSQMVCSGSSATLSPVVTGGAPPFTYLWSTGAMTASIVVTPTTATTYSVQVTDACGAVAADTALVQVLPAIQQTQTLSFCPGDSVTVGGMTYTTSATIIDTLPGVGGACDTLLTYVLQLLPQIILNDTISFCAGDTVTIGGVAYTGAGTVLDTLPGMGGSCDTLATYVLQLANQFMLADTLTLCPGDSVTIGGLVYSQPGTVLDTLPGTSGGCDTLVTYTILAGIQPLIEQKIEFCPGDSVSLNGQTYTQPDTVSLTIPALTGCDTLATYVLLFAPQPTVSRTISFCPGDSISIGGVTYSQPDTITGLLPATVGCDTVATYVLQFAPQPTVSRTISFCPGDSVKIDGVAYSQPDTVISLLPAAVGCDTIATYFLELAPQPTRTLTIFFCPGDSVTIDGVAYGQPDTVMGFIPAAVGCDTLATYVLVLAPQPTVTRTLEFCSGDSVKVNGVVYTQPATIVFNIPAAEGCDTVATYILKYIVSPEPTAVVVNCPGDITVEADPNASGMVVTYAQPTATTNCVCPGVQLILQQGLPSGSIFPLGITKVCYNGRDTCGNAITCCFNVTVEESTPCDIKVINCIKYELLSITEDAKKRKTYRIRTTNNCANRMIYLAIQVPNGVVADLPANNSIFTAASGRTYLVRNPNYSPFYSVRYSSVSDSIQNGESDVFRYTLPPQADPDYIHVMVRLEPFIYYEAHLNTFYCPIGFEDPAGKPEHSTGQQRAGDAFNLFPNPTDGTLFADLSDWAGQKVQLRVYSAQGRLLQSAPVLADYTAQPVDLPANLSNGMYLLEVVPAQGPPQTRKFSIAH